MTEEKFLKANSKDFFGEHSEGLTPRERDVRRKRSKELEKTKHSTIIWHGL